MINNVLLTDVTGNATPVASVELSNKKTSSMYFGTWGKSGANSAEVVSWCDELIKTRKRELSNLMSLRSAAQRQMVEGLDVETLRTLLSEKENA